MLCNVNIDNCTTTCYSIDTGLPVILATASVCIGGPFATNFAWRLFCCCCIAGEVSAKKDFSKTKSNAQGECRMPSFLDLLMHWIEDDMLLLRLLKFASRGALVTNNHGEQSASGRRDVVAAPNVLLVGSYCVI